MGVTGWAGCGVLVVVGMGLPSAVEGQLARELAERRASEEPVSISAVRAEAATPRLDGRLDDAVWQRAEPVTGFVQVTPEDGAEPSERTEVRVAYDDEAVYIGARMFDSDAAGIASRLGRRDTDTSSDLFRVAIDSYHDHRTAFKFVVNPAGVRADEVAANDDANGPESWDPVWEAVTRVDSLGWVAEIRIPLSQLRFSEDPEQVWGVNFSREIFRKNELVRWSWARNTEQGYASLFGHLEGLRDLPQPRRLEVLPYTVASADFDRSQDPASPFDDGSVQSLNAGVDLKFGLTSDLTVDATFNPDFGQVEVDPAVVNLTAFETFFEERRPFFVEGQNLFQFGAGSGGFIFGAPQLFYSRRVGRAPSRPTYEPGGYADNPPSTSILGAAKLSGQTGGWSIGVLNALAAREEARVQTPDGARLQRPVEPLANYSVLSLRRDFRGGDTGVGALATGVYRDLDAESFTGLRSSAFSAGADFFHRFGDRQWALSGTLSGSRINGDPDAITAAQRASARYFQRPDQDYVSVDSGATSMQGWAGSLQFGKVAGNWTFGTDLFAYSPGFEVNDAGFGTRVDQIFHGIRLNRRWLDQGTVFRNKFVSATWAQNWNFGGVRRGRSAYLGFGGQFLNYWQFNVGGSYSFTNLSDNATRGGPVMEQPAVLSTNGFLMTDTRKPVAFSLEGSYAHNAYDGWGLSAGPGVTFRPSGAVDLSVSLIYEKSHSMGFYVTQLADETATATYGGRYVFSELVQEALQARLRAAVSLSPSLTIQWYAQPLVASGDYFGFKELARPRTFDFLTYGEDGGSTLTLDEQAGVYTADPDGDGAAPGFTFRDPDFLFRSLRSNLVLRWEYMPGSTLFLVWNHGRAGSYRDPTGGLLQDMSHLLDETMRNTLLVKVNYWLSM